MISFSSSVYIVSTYILHVKFNDSCVISVSTRACMRPFLYKRHGAEDARAKCLVLRYITRVTAPIESEAICK